MYKINKLKKLLFTSILVFSLLAPSISSAQTILFPARGGTGIGSATAGDVGKFLKVSDDLPFTYTFATAITAPCGIDTQIQFNDALAFGCDTGFTWDKTLDTLGLPANSIIDWASGDFTIQGNTDDARMVFAGGDFLFSGNVYPSASDTYNLGYAGVGWASLELANSGPVKWGGNGLLRNWVNAGIQVGKGDSTGVVSSYSNFDLVLQTGNPTTGNITLTDGVNGNITIAPDGTGKTYLKNDVSSLGALLDTASIATADKTFTFPNQSGTFALVENIDESAQDAVGTILTDTNTIDFTYTDATPSITADVKLNSSTTQVLFNDGGSVIGGDAELVYNKTTNILTTYNTTASFFKSPINTDLDISTLTEGYNASFYTVAGVTGNGGDLTISTGNGAVNNGGGRLTLNTGNSPVGGNGDGGSIDIFAGAGRGLGEGGTYFASAGDGGATGQGGRVEFIGGDSGTSLTGGAIIFTAGDGVGTNSSGGSLEFRPGVKTGSGTAGKIYFYEPTGFAAILDNSNIATSNKTFTLPNTTGTFALLEVANVFTAGQTISSASALTLGLSSTNAGAIIFKNASNTNTLTLQSGATSSTHTLTLPLANGAASTLLMNNGLGVLSWSFPTILSTIATYNSIATVSGGMPAEYATVDLTAQGAAIGSTRLYTVPISGAGMYRISWYASVTTTATTSSVLGGTKGFQIDFTDADDSVAKTSPTPAIAPSQTNNSNTTASMVSGVITIYAKASTDINYAMDYTSVGVPSSMKYNLHVKLEKM